MKIYCLLLCLHSSNSKRILKVWYFLCLKSYTWLLYFFLKEISAAPFHQLRKSLFTSFHSNLIPSSSAFIYMTGYNKKFLAENEKQYEWNCRNKDECPLENKCLTPWVIYEADVITLNTSRKFYIGLADTPFKEHYNNHKRNFRKKRYEKRTELSKYIWSLQESGIEFNIHWKILSHVKGMTKRSYCSLFLTGKLWLLHYFDDMHLLNKKSNADTRLSDWYH